MQPVLLLLMGCGGPERQAAATATELCRWNQLTTLAPTLLPSGVDLSTLVREADLRFVREQEAEEEAERAELAKNPFGGLVGVVSTMATAMTDAGKVIIEAQAKVAQCDVQVVIDGAVANVRVKRTAPQPFDESAGLEKLGEINRLPTHEERLALVSGWLSGATQVAVSEADLRLERVGERWLANLGLPEKAIAETETSLAKEREAVARAEAAKAELAKFEVVEARYYKKRDRFFTEPVVDLTVKNGTSTAISRAYFHGTVKSPNRSVPWIDEDFNYQVPGGVEPGEQVRWRLAPNMFSKWGQDTPKDAVFSVTVVRLDGPDGNELYSTAGLEDAVEKVAALEAEIVRIRSTYLGSTPVEVQP